MEYRYSEEVEARSMSGRAACMGRIVASEAVMSRSEA